MIPVLEQRPCFVDPRCLPTRLCCILHCSDFGQHHRFIGMIQPPHSERLDDLVECHPLGVDVGPALIPVVGVDRSSVDPLVARVPLGCLSPVAGGHTERVVGHDPYTTQWNEALIVHHRHESPPRRNEIGIGPMGKVRGGFRLVSEGEIQAIFEGFQSVGPSDHVVVEGVARLGVGDIRPRDGLAVGHRFDREHDLPVGEQLEVSRRRKRGVPTLEHSDNIELATDISLELIEQVRLISAHCRSEKHRFGLETLRPILRSSEDERNQHNDRPDEDAPSVRSGCAHAPNVPRRE